MHIALANYQVGIWRCCLKWELDIPDHLDHGLVIDAPGHEVIKLFSCLTELKIELIMLVLLKCPQLLAFNIH